MRVCQVNPDFDTPSSYSPPLCTPSQPSMATLPFRILPFPMPSVPYVALPTPPLSPSRPSMATTLPPPLRGIEGVRRTERVYCHQAGSSS